MVERGGPASAKGWAFERFVSEILAGQLEVTGVEGEIGAAGDLGVDIVGQQDGRIVLEGYSQGNVRLVTKLLNSGAPT